jgi:hypothetical protein
MFTMFKVVQSDPLRRGLGWKFAQLDAGRGNVTALLTAGGSAPQVPISFFLPLHGPKVQIMVQKSANRTNPTSIQNKVPGQV